ncbi:MAG: MBL fold metallo-hydrolase [Acutalibacteraceae bacterium]
MNIQTLTLGPLATNCYLVRADESSRAVIIDLAANSKRLLAALEEQGLTLEAILLTHAHFDHIGALKNLRAATNARVYIGEADKDDPSRMCHDLLTYTDTYQDGDTVAAGGLTFGCSLRPAIRRAPCACCAKPCSFSGDTLFARLLRPDRLPRRKQPGHGRVFEAAVHAAA